MLKRILAILFVYLPAGFVAFSVFMVLIFRWVPVTTTPLMLVRWAQSFKEGSAISPKQEWVPIEHISKKVIKAFIAAEDQRFFLHDGFDFKEIAKMKQELSSKDGSIRGCSTISQQTAKNCFTFCTHTWLRKALESYYTILIEKLWGKRRIMEVYLNVAEMGPGIYGIEAAAREYYHIKASDLAMADATSLACCLPNPLHRNPQWVNCHMAARRSKIARYSQSIEIADLR